MKQTLIAASLMLSLTVPAPLVAADLPDLGDASAASMSGADEVKIGKDVVRGMRQNREISDDAEVTAYLNELGRRLAVQAQVPDMRFNYFLVPDPSINAFALPGGFVGVNSGLILTTQSEAELASVLAHETAHVAQHHIARMSATSGSSQLMVLAAILAGALAAKSGNSEMGMGALNAGIGLSIQKQLSFSRDFEREADRFGMQYMVAAGFDALAMPAFFQRMQQVSRNNDNNALAFLRTHPVTVERISEAENRAQGLTLRMRADSADYLLAREKIRVSTLGADEAARFYRTALAQRQFLNEGATWYGLALCRLAQRDPAKAREALANAQRLLPANPMLYSLQANIALLGNDWAGARSAYRSGLQAFPSNRALLLSELDFLIDHGERATTAARLQELLGRHPEDAELYRRQARLYADKDPLRYHAALGNALYYEANYRAAMEQFQLASKAVGDDFYLRSSIEARIRELDKLLKDERKSKGKFGSAGLAVR
jgi:predicted Zn-dependent protease